MHKRNTKGSPPEITPFQTVNVNFNSDAKHPSLYGKAVFRALWRRNLIFAVAACLLLVSAATVASDKFGHHDYSAPVPIQTLEAGVRETPRGSARKMVRARSTMEGVKQFERSKTSFVGGSDEQTTGKMVVDALQSQEQTDFEVSRNRMLVKEGSIAAKVPGSALDSTAERIASLAEDPLFGEGGYVAHRSTSENGGWSKQSTYRITELDLRIPSAHFESAMQRAKQLVDETSPSANESPDHKGTITSFSHEARDVTDEFVDATARADTVDASRKAIQVLMSRANEVDDVMRIQEELNRLTQQSEVLRRKALGLENRSVLSTLKVRLEEWREEDSKGDYDGDGETYRWSPLNSACLAWSHVSLLATFLFDTLAYVLVWSIPCIGVYYLCARVFSKL